MDKPIRVGIYGSSFFLTAIAASLEEHERIRLLHFSSATPARVIQRQQPNILLWQHDYPPADLPILFDAGLWLVEINGHRNQISVQHASETKIQVLPIAGTANFVARIEQLARRNGEKDFTS